MKHAVLLYNCVPNRLSGFTPLELLTKSKADHRDLLCLHVWGCPAIVLDLKLQNDQKLPKWNKCAYVGQCLGYSDERLSLVANVRHLSIGHVSLQFHVVLDDLFEAVICNGDDDAVVNSICDGLFNWNRKLYIEDEFDADDSVVFSVCSQHSEPKGELRDDYDDSIVHIP